jgi:eukaryotic-like serine/threonine-protein kinase
MNTAAHNLVGQLLQGGWTVTERLDHREDETGGAFSVGYLARHSSGRMGYVKALDYSAAFESDNVPAALNALTAQYEAERALLDLCANRNLKRIVKVLGADTIKVLGFSPASVSYLIFEKADADAREVLSGLDPADQLTALQLGHHACVALAQLHSCGAAHQDLKPSNFLVWLANANVGLSGKLGDLGNAHLPGRPAPHDDLQVPGDLAYAPPEQLYGACQHLGESNRRRAADLFMLGNLLCFLMVRTTYSAVLYRSLDPTQHWTGYGGSFTEVLPALVDAHGIALARIQDALHAAISEEFVALLDQLCNPDPARRGDYRARARGNDPLSLERFVTKLTLLQHRLRIHLTNEQTA